MRHRRSRLPLVLLAGLAVLLGGALALATSSRTDLLAWFSGANAAPTVSPGRSAAAPGASTDAAGPSGSLASSPGPSGSDVGAGGSAAPSASASLGPAGTPGTSATPGLAPSPAVATTGTAKAVYNGSRANKVVALTFDDGYSPVALRQILAILKQQKVVATFFPYGWAVHADPAGWHMVADAGYPIGNHTLSHAILTTLTPAQVIDQLVRGRNTIDLYSGATSVPLFRPPGGAFNAVTARAIAKAGYPTIVMWDVDTFDWQGPSPATIVARAIRGTNGSIVLMHSGPLNTPKALPAIIANYRARGFTFVTVPQLLAGR